MAKRKREGVDSATTAQASEPVTPTSTTKPLVADSPAIHLQVITGTYEKTLHGFVVSIPPALDNEESSGINLPAKFHDTFLFTAHTSPIRTVAVSSTASNSTKCILATSSADERINLYTLSALLLPDAASSLKPLSGHNKHLGALHHHVNTPTSLVFTPNRTKLLSAGADGQIHILRTRDWNLLSTLKVPKPKPKPINYAKDYGEANGPRIDTFGSEGYGGGTGGINDIALHPSQKILLSVGEGERAVRMWNLMTGRKAGVLVFDRKDVPMPFGRAGNNIEWSAKGEEYAVAFDRGVVVFDMDSKPKARISTTPLTKIHAMRYVTLPARILSAGEDDQEAIMLATEDGRVLFFSTAPTDPDDLATVPLLGALGGRSLGMATRVKDVSLQVVEDRYFVITGCSDGIVRVWDLCGHGNKSIEVAEDEVESKKPKVDDEPKEPKAKTPEVVKQIGVLVGIYETSRRITCLTSMTMVEGDEPEDEEMKNAEDEEEDSDDDSE